MLPRLTALLAVAIAAAACSGGSSSSSPPASSQGPPVVSTLPASGTVRLSDGKTYTVAPPGATLHLDNLKLHIHNVGWNHHIDVGVTPPGTRIYAVFSVDVSNLTTSTQTISAIQIWLRNTLNHTFLASAGAKVPDPLIGRSVQPGQTVTGDLVFPLPGRMEGGLLVYRFGDTPAKATHVGIARYA
jgi:hypothetical protein